MADNKGNHRSVMAATLAASSLMMIFGLTYHALASRLGVPVAAPIAPDALEQLPSQIGDWTGEDVAMDEALVRATDTDAHINRHYSRKGGMESVEVFIGCSFSACDRVIHRPENCYPKSGWTPGGNRSVELPLGGGMKLPCTLLRFSRGDLGAERTTVLHYYIADGQPCANVSVLGPRLWRVSGRVNYVARVLITAPNRGLTNDSAERIVSDFAVDSAPSITRLLETLEAGRRSGESPNASEGR